jgi:N-sulfoglucosamine sulfohydrolase
MEDRWKYKNRNEKIGNRRAKTNNQENNMTNRIQFLQRTAAAVMACGLLLPDFAAAQDQSAKPNILWIYIEDINPWLGCYGDKTVPTPNMDKLARDGILFERCYTPAPICSPTRSSLITGKMPTTIGVHNHDGAYTKLPDYLEGNTLPEIFQKNGYQTFNHGKDHYNFVYDRGKLYSKLLNKAPRLMSDVSPDAFAPWRGLPDKAKPFFGQIQLVGDKNRPWRELPDIPDTMKEMLPTLATPESVAEKLPPIYPQNEVFLSHLASAYDCVAITDLEVGIIMELLEEDGLLDNTIVFLSSDHGANFPRSKQFTYEEGLRVPFIIRAPEQLAKAKSNSRRKDLVCLLDASATSLAFANIGIPAWYDSKDLFDKRFKREFVVSSKDRMDWTIDRVRALTTDDGYRYIRNYMLDRPYTQLNYRSGEGLFKNMEELFAKGKLSDVQARFFSNYRPAEELYNLKDDPYEINNLAYNPDFEAKLLELRGKLANWVKETDDKGQYPESQENLQKVYEKWKDRFITRNRLITYYGKPFEEVVTAPEYDFLRK